jgi:hypothetical protein
MRGIGRCSVWDNTNATSVSTSGISITPQAPEMSTVQDINNTTADSKLEFFIFTKSDSVIDLNNTD